MYEYANTHLSIGNIFSYYFLNSNFDSNYFCYELIKNMIHFMKKDSSTLLVDILNLFKDQISPK